MATLFEFRRSSGWHYFLALIAGTGVRFISDLENGMETCEIGKVLENLGMDPVFQLREQQR